MSDIQAWEIVGGIGIFLGVAAVLFGVACIFTYSILQVKLYFQRNTFLSREKYFHEHFASLPEVQQMYDLSLLHTHSPIFIGKNCLDSRIGEASSAAPDSYEQVVAELTLRSAAKIHALESELVATKQEARDATQELRDKLQSHETMMQGALFVLVMYVILRTLRQV